MNYVKVWHESENWVLGQVLDINKENPTHNSSEEFDPSEEKVKANASIIGYRDERGLLKTPKTPLSPGDEVYKANKRLIKESLGIERGRIHIGNLDGTDLKVKLDANELVQKHCSILARTGSGKSYTCGVIIEELIENNVPVVIIDPHGEFHSIKEKNKSKRQRARMDEFGVSPKGYSSTEVYSPEPDLGKPLRLNGINLGAREIMNLLPTNLTNTQTGILYKAVKELNSRKGNYSLEDIIRTVKGSDSSAKWNLVTQLELISELKIFSGRFTKPDELVNPGSATIINLKGVNPDIQEMIVTRICTDIFRSRKNEEIPPAMLVVEEAHNFAPERGFKSAVSTDILRMIASEGRKFGLGLTVVSQRPARVDKNVLSQCNTQIILKVTNPNDLNAIKKGVEGLDSEMQDEIKSLPTGVALLVSNGIEKPIFVDIRVRRSKHGGGAVDVTRRVGKSDKRTKKKNEWKSKTKDDSSIMDKIFGKK